ncbi:polyribonucleotide nucleotidyltransferase, partial [Candidatus Dojkabacteria bacterium]|nr:polyribonucleotide nucleotidyltransferase [Candidatus Dojkabacteria bacterium]
MQKVKRQVINLPDGDIMLSTGKVAWLAAGSVTLTIGGTVLLANVSIDDQEMEQDFFPLSVEYIEKMYAGGAISSSRFLKREGFPADEAIIKARQVDHTIRPLFPKGFRRPVSVVLTVLAYDGQHDPEFLSVLGASAALKISGAPFFGPAASAVIGLHKNGELIVNPSVDVHHDLEAEFVFSGKKGKLLNIEGWGKEVPEAKMKEMVDMAMERIATLCDAQEEFAADIARPMLEFAETAAPAALISEVESLAKDKIKDAIYLLDREDNGRQRQLKGIKEELVEKLVTGKDDSEYSAFDIDMAVEYVAKKVMRQGVLKEDKRLSGRKLDEIRPLSAEVDVLPTVHGSALFSRGLTQSLTIVTLGSTRMAQTIDGMEGEEEKSFMHHYNMASFAAGEAGRYQYKPGRREIGHGMIGENALRYMVPSQDEFPYTIRVVSEIMTSNGSTSMAAPCASSLALMAAGVPLKEQVAGIGVGLVTDDEDEGKYKLLLDIEGVEDFYGDMDFKVTGTKNGVTAIQFETKLKGVSPEIIKQAFDMAQKGRMQVLDVMNAAIAEPRAELAPSAPRVETLHIERDMIGELIGPGGKNVKGIAEEAEKLTGHRLDIDISDDGKVVVTAGNAQQLEFALGRIKALTSEPEIGTIYEGTIDKVMPYGAFVDITPGISGLIHVSEMSDGFVSDPS